MMFKTTANMPGKIKVENIVHFQSVPDFNEATGKDYYDLDARALIKTMLEYYEPGKHDTRTFDVLEINTPFAGWKYEYEGHSYLLATYQRSSVIGLSAIVEYIPEGEI